MQINRWTNPLKAITLCSLPTLKSPVKSPRKKLKKRSRMRFLDYSSTRKEAFNLTRVLWNPFKWACNVQENIESRILLDNDGIRLLQTRQKMSQVPDLRR